VKQDQALDLGQPVGPALAPLPRLRRGSDPVDIIESFRALDCKALPARIGFGQHDVLPDYLSPDHYRL